MMRQLIILAVLNAFGAGVNAVLAFTGPAWMLCGPMALIGIAGAALCSWAAIRTWGLTNAT